MSKFKLILKILTLGIFFLMLTACHQQQDANTLRVGTIAGPETELMEVAKKIAANHGLNIKIIEFSDYTMPNEALVTGSIDANMFQHLPYLQAAIKAKGYQLTPIAKTFVYPMALYSKKITNISQLPDKAIVAIPNDPSNEARALLLLQKADLIKLKPGANITATVEDIGQNPKQLNIKEIDAAQLPRVLPDVDIAAINTNYATEANLSPSRDGLITEDASSPYANIIVVKTADKMDPRFLKLVQAIHSAEVLHKAQQLFHGQAIPAWK